MNNTVIAMLASSGGAAGAHPLPTRKGIVRADGKAVRDDTGSFHPLGMTFFWAMQGWRGERDRFLKNLDWLVQHGRPDYLRILGQVDWSGRAIDPAWPDYDQVYTGARDAIYGRGMRHELTMLGSPYPDPAGLARRLSGLIRPKAETVINSEIWNEWAQNGGSLQAMKDAARVFLEQSGVALVALSSDMGDTDISPATLVTAHTDRDGGDDGWRMVRQGYDAIHAPCTYSGNEPPGINSSLNTLESPLQLAMLRAVSVQSGGALWVLHVGDMVMGLEDPSHGRHANLWEIDRLAESIKAVRQVDTWMPSGVENWHKSAGNPNIRPQALVADITGWPDGGPGVNRAYCALTDGAFTQTLCGIKGTRTFTQVMEDGATYRVTGIQPETGELLDVTLKSGQSFTINGPADGMLGYILNGTRVPGGAVLRAPVVYPPIVVAEDVLLET
jgi:hypothetical protein